MMELREVVRNFYIFFSTACRFYQALAFQIICRQLFLYVLLFFIKRSGFFFYILSLKDLMIWIDLYDFSPKATTFTIR